jgi:hypothetical protein
VIEGLVPLLVFNSGGGLAVYVFVRRYVERVGAWREAARIAGLVDVRRASPWSVRGLAAQFGAHALHFDSYFWQNVRGRFESGTRIVIRGNSGLTLRPTVAETTLESVLGFQEIELGDKHFDDRVHVQGTPATVHALLDADMRAAVLELLVGVVRPEHASSALGTGEIRGGDLWADLPDRPRGSRVPRLAQALTSLLVLAQKLEPPADLAARIAENTLREPEWRVRVRNLQLLAADYPQHGATREALRQACQDEREKVQLEAATALHDDVGRRTLLEIASREWSDDFCAARAVTLLGSRLPAEQAQGILAHALRTGRSGTVLACLETLGRLRDPASLSSLARVLAVESGALAVAAAKALGASRAAAAEQPLLKALARGSSESRAAAAEALGRVGSAAAVLALKEAAARDGADAVFRRAARQAVAEIQSRLQGASPGQLSLAEGDAGDLSLADEDPAGRVSIATSGDPKQKP